MVPAAVAFEDTLPRTRTGKVDRRALPRPDRFGRSNIRQAIAPRDPVEQQVATI
ncbi:hypothetical protein BH24PSE2_BH24PSE2_21720 [soil metagenome]